MSAASNRKESRVSRLRWRWFGHTQGGGQGASPGPESDAARRSPPADGPRSTVQVDEIGGPEKNKTPAPWAVAQHISDGDSQSSPSPEPLPWRDKSFEEDSLPEVCDERGAEPCETFEDGEEGRWAGGKRGSVGVGGEGGSPWVGKTLGRTSV